MTKKEKDNWELLSYRMEAEGFHYCFEGYSDWNEIEDETFHQLRLEYLKIAKLLEEYVNMKNEEAQLN